METNKHLWEIEHPYYCAESNYYAPGNAQPTQHFKSWTEFFAEFGNSDIDFNFLIRWDWKEDEGHEYKGDDYYRNGILYIFWLGQRKGVYFWSTIDICRADEDLVREFLFIRWEYIKKMWQPFT